jgi:hypothetical protein
MIVTFQANEIEKSQVSIPSYSNHYPRFAALIGYSKYLECVVYQLRNHMPYSPPFSS